MSALGDCSFALRVSDVKLDRGIARSKRLCRSRNGDFGNVIAIGEKRVIPIRRLVGYLRDHGQRGPLAALATLQQNGK